MASTPQAQSVFALLRSWLPEHKVIGLLNKDKISMNVQLFLRIQRPHIKDFLKLVLSSKTQCTRNHVKTE